ncbi:MAG TPA: hypothetical protein VNM72_13970 [Blastocatellia bacterium]|nr:hypothetical protein [Blastocatellia bacterium]
MGYAEVIFTAVTVRQAEMVGPERTAAPVGTGILVEMDRIFRMRSPQVLRRAIRSFLAVAMVDAAAMVELGVKVEMVEQAERAAMELIVRVVREDPGTAVEAAMEGGVAKEAEEVMGAMEAMVETVAISS